MKAPRNRHRLWLMLVCYLVPLAALGTALLLGAPMTGVLLVALLLLCLAVHLSIMVWANRNEHFDEALRVAKDLVVEEDMPSPRERREPRTPL